MSTPHRPRLTPLQRTLLAIATVASVAVLAAPAWIEAVFGASPDHGDGSLEALFAVAGLACLAVSFGVGVRWHRQAVARADA